jgi:hypothetical protein
MQKAAERPQIGITLISCADKQGLIRLYHRKAMAI